MKLASIINAWDGVELLKYAMASTLSRVDLFVIVYQTTSNYGEYYDPLKEIQSACAVLTMPRVIIQHYVPHLNQSGTDNETKKRNIGLRIAKECGATHFFFQDCDEMYSDFSGAVDQYAGAGKEGSVCPIYTYFKLPTLRFEFPDNYYVPFVHKLTPITTAGMQEYPYYVDPTRRVNCKDVALLSEPMHHFSYVRRDIVRKCRNSSARNNILKSGILEDYANAAPGRMVKDIFNQKLVEVPNKFGIVI